jgi:hypothetical protein
MHLGHQTVDVQSEIRHPADFALKCLYKVSDFRGIGSFSRVATPGFGLDKGADLLDDPTQVHQFFSQRLRLYEI